MYGQLVESQVLAAMSTLSAQPLPPSGGPQQAADVRGQGAAEVLACIAGIQAAASQGAPPQPQPVHELHVDVLYACGLLRPLSEPQLLLTFDLACPPMHDISDLMLQVGLPRGSLREHTLPEGPSDPAMACHLKPEINPGNNAVPGITMLQLGLQQTNLIPAQVPVKSAGNVDALVLWWQADMDPSGRIKLATAPKWLRAGWAGECGWREEPGGDGGPLQRVTQRWRDHWKQCWVPLAPGPSGLPPGLWGRQRAMRATEQVSLRISHDELSISVCRDFLVYVGSLPPSSSSLAPSGWPVTVGGPPPTGSFPKLHSPPPPPPPSLPLWNSPMRMMQLGDLAGRWAPLWQAVEQQLGSLLAMSAVPEQSGSVEVVVLGDGPVLPLMVDAVYRSVIGESSIRGEVPSSGAPLPGCRSVAIAAVQDAGSVGISLQWIRAEAEARGSSCNVTCMDFKQLLTHLTAQDGATSGGSPERPPLLVVSEPYYRDLEGVLPWHNLRLWRQLQTIRWVGPTVHAFRNRL